MLLHIPSLLTWRAIFPFLPKALLNYSQTQHKFGNYMENDIDTIFGGFIERFLQGRMDAQVFSIAYMELWRVRQKNDLMLKSEYYFGGFINSVFMSCDNYSPDPDRMEYEFDEKALRDNIIMLYAEYNEEIKLKNSQNLAE